jgi:hypothetical protein
MTHARLVELVAQVNGALTLMSWPFILYHVLGKSVAAPDLKARLDLRRGQIISSIVLDIEETLRPYWPRAASRIYVEPGYGEELTTVLSDAAKDAIRGCLADNEGLSLQAASLKGLASKVLAWDRACYWLLFCTAVLAPVALVLWFFCEGMSDRIAKLAIVVPILPAVLAVAAATERQVHMYRANNAIIEEKG